ncbi:MAG: hypothetical protein NTX50_26960 [Candidatus Sumerlaeota bacterium]|nr:hypothetical protein [Candidatus Sumerlaeota bacterium]
MLSSCPFHLLDWTYEGLVLISAEVVNADCFLEWNWMQQVETLKLSQADNSALKEMKSHRQCSLMSKSSWLQNVRHSRREKMIGLDLRDEFKQASQHRTAFSIVPLTRKRIHT